ncbi:MAG: hypothetical protein JW783_07890 [Bacteroidales bacterium]|nr:hypothetical protein [Bacteroidales bacterium]MBN2749860.1 hypothetical protein [Bacteroidales bacterium]
MISIHFDKADGMITIVSKGEISFEEMLGAPDILTRENLPKNLKILEDASEAEPNFYDERIPEIIQNLITQSAHLNSVKHAVIQRTPINTAISMMAERELRESHYHLKTFFSRAAALRWLNSEEL